MSSSAEAILNETVDRAIVASGAKTITNEIVDTAPVTSANIQNNTMQVPADNVTNGSGERTQADGARELAEEPPNFTLSEEDQEVNKKNSESAPPKPADQQEFPPIPPQVPPEVTAQSSNNVVGNDSAPKPVDEEKDVFAGMFNNSPKTLPRGESTEGMEPIDGTARCARP